jgi:hypothetical protein
MPVFMHCLGAEAWAKHKAPVKKKLQAYDKYMNFGFFKEGCSDCPAARKLFRERRREQLPGCNAKV